jgi:pimeloyl-ACP methyl ester carboxylesterase
MYVHESGTPGSPVIVFIHGAGQSGAIWREHMERLAGVHCLTPDLPGFGRRNRLPAASLRETADLIAELIETPVPARRASVVGISSGAMVIHALLDRHPDRVEREVIDGGSVRPWGRRFRFLYFTAVSPFIHARPVMALFRASHDPEDLRAASRRAFRRAVVELVLKPIAAIGSSIPTLLVAGEQASRRPGWRCTAPTGRAEHRPRKPPA